MPDRRLAAILAADVVGYSALMEVDKAGTLNRLKELRRSIVTPTIERHSGRIVKLMGDGLLAEFASVVDAAVAALELQAALADPTDTDAIRLRVGINLGDVVIDEGDIYGDGVNVAARLEALADPGGICISSIVHESLGSRIHAEFEDGGAVQVKNISRPIRVYHWRPATTCGTLPPKNSQMPKPENTLSVGSFASLSSDADTGFFSEGLADDIATATGRMGQLKLVADPDAARFYLDGKVRISGPRVRVSARLTDRMAGDQVWADRFEDASDDPFEVQDRIGRQIVTAIHAALGAGVYTNAWQVGTESYEAWDLCAQAFYTYQAWSPDAFRNAASLFGRAVDIDPAYIAARSGRAHCQAQLALIDADHADELLRAAEEEITLCRTMAGQDTLPLSALRALEVARGNYRAAIAAAEEALGMKPDNGSVRASLAWALLADGQHEASLRQITRSIASTRDPAGWYLVIEITARLLLGERDPLVDHACRVAAEKPKLQPGLVLAAALAVETGRSAEAAELCAKVLSQDPDFSRAVFLRHFNFRLASDTQRLAEALAKTGLPE